MASLAFPPRPRCPSRSLYERHKALTYPRTDSRNLPEDYVPVVKDTLEMLANSGMKHLAPFAAQAVQGRLCEAHQTRVRQRQGQ
jgi:DNA topoisomerase IA